MRISSTMKIARLGRGTGYTFCAFSSLMAVFRGQRDTVRCVRKIEKSAMSVEEPNVGAVLPMTRKKVRPLDGIFNDRNSLIDQWLMAVEVAKLEHSMTLGTFLEIMVSVGTGGSGAMLAEELGC